MSSADLLAAARDLVCRSQDVEAELLVHLGEIDERRLYLDCAFPSMFAFCVGELGFSEDAAYNRIMVARAGRRLPAIVEAIREGRVHLWGMRLLIPHLTEANHTDLIARAAGKSKRDIEELVAALAPRQAVASMIRSVPGRLVADELPPAPVSAPAPAPAPASASALSTQHEAIPDAPPSNPQPPRIGSAVLPLAALTYKVQFTAGSAFRDRLREAQDLMRHRVPDGNLETILGAALDLLIEQVKKERFAVGRKTRSGSSSTSSTTNPASGNPATRDPATTDPATTDPATTNPAKETDQTDQTDQTGGEAASRHVPDAIKRAVYERDGGRCTFVDVRGRRCAATGALEFDHVDGFARTGRHDVDSLRLLCRPHNQHAAEQMYGRLFMERFRKSRDPPVS